jgi:hypothetical protein
MTARAWPPALRSAAVCEVVWIGADGSLGAIAATPLVFEERPALAFPYAYAQLARELASAGAVALALSDPRMSGAGWRPLAVVGSPRLIEDGDGELFCSTLLTQELRKHPPSRALADSILLRREHWWFLPRLIVTLDAHTEIDLAERVGGAGDGVLAVVDAAGALRVAATEVADDGRLRALGGDLPARDGAPHDAVLVRHDFSPPDLERWVVEAARGVLTGEVFDAGGPLGEVALPRPLGLIARMRRQRDLARACRRELDRRRT